MTIEEVEQFVAEVSQGWAQECAENRGISRDTQRLIDVLALRNAQVDERIGKRVDQFAEEAAVRNREFHERDRQLGLRIESLVSAMGEFLAKLQKN